MKTNTQVGPVGLLAAVEFAARKHRSQRRKDADGTPYINHPIRVGALLADPGCVADLATLQAALLHDTVEDMQTTPEELASLFGPAVCSLVLEVTDDKSLPKEERKRRQIEHARKHSPKVRLIKLADKIANVTELTDSAPLGWPIERKLAYVHWAEAVIARIGGSNAALEQLFDKVAGEKRSLFGGSSGARKIVAD
jgi:guanosine-3',5'-bis(diphosphate) 3'-pyrophosphohydrolase